MKEVYEIIREQKPEKLISVLEDKIYEFNSEKINRSNGSLFAYSVRDVKAEIIAGIGGWTWDNACEITQLWVNENNRINGLGKRLLEFTENEARQKGCRTILVRSYAFQAPEFYQKYGFKIEHVLKNFPGHYNYYFLVKRIEK